MMKKMLEAAERPKNPRMTRSPIIAPTSLPCGPPFAYPTAQNSLPTKARAPRIAVTIGKQMPAMKSMTKVEGANSRKLQWALCALLNLYHWSQVSLLEYLPFPTSGYPPFSIYLPVAARCSSPKFFFMNSSVNTSDLIFPEKMKPIRRSSKARATAASSTQPQSEDKEKVRRLPPKCCTCITQLILYLVIVSQSISDWSEINYFIKIKSLVLIILSTKFLSFYTGQHLYLRASAHPFMRTYQRDAYSLSQLSAYLTAMNFSLVTNQIFIDAQPFSQCHFSRFYYAKPFSFCCCLKKKAATELMLYSPYLPLNHRYQQFVNLAVIVFLLLLTCLCYPLHLHSQSPACQHQQSLINLPEKYCVWQDARHNRRQNVTQCYFICSTAYMK